MSWTVAGIGCGSAVLAALVLFAFRMRAYWAAGPRLSSDVSDFSLSRYEPMTRLLESEDLEFLKSQSGYRPEIGEKLRRDRVRIFRLYLTDLAADFRALHSAARVMVANSGEEHADLIGSLFRQQVTFWRAIAAIEFRLAMGGLGFAKPEVRGLIEAMETMRMELTRISGAPSAA